MGTHNIVNVASFNGSFSIYTPALTEPIAEPSVITHTINTTPDLPEECVPEPVAPHPPAQPLDTSTCTSPSEQGKDSPHPPTQPLDTSTCTSPSEQGKDSPHPPTQPLDTSTCTSPSEQGKDSPHLPLNTSTCTSPSEQGKDSPHLPAQPLNTSTMSSEQAKDSLQLHSCTTSKLEAKPFATQHPDSLLIESIVSY